MSIYYITIFIFIFLGYFYDRLALERINNDRSIFIIIVTIVFSLIYGFRFEVGVDWFNYIKVYERHVADIFALDTLELGYKLLNVIAYFVDQGIVTVIFLSTVLFFSFTFLGARKLGLNPFYFFAIVAPYHLVISGVNLTRQSIALSIFIYAIAYLVNNNKPRFLFFILLAAAFHTSALCFAPLFFIEKKKRYLFFILLLVVPPVFISMLSEYQQYLDSNMENAGLYLRTLYLLGPTILLLLHNRSIKECSLIEKRLIYLVCLSFPIIIGFSLLSSTIADRFCYYFILLGTLCWMLISKRDNPANPVYLKSYGSLLLFISSLLAFVIWTLYSRYISSYEFDSYFYYWLT